MSITIRLPKLGESILSATIVQWMKKEGDTVVEDEPLCEVATDKVNSEIPSTVAGKIIKIVAQVDQEVEIGAPLVVVEPVGAVQEEPEPEEYHAQPEHHESTKGFISPAVLRFVRDQGIPLTELDKIRGTGQGGRITKKDVESYAVARWKKGSQEGIKRQPMSPMRKAIAENMVRSFYSAPHAYLVAEIDLTDLMASIRQKREAFFAEHGAKLTITSYFVKAIAHAVEKYPLLNASLEEDTVLVKSDVNVGIAVAVDDGLVVPVIKQCQLHDIKHIAKTIADLSIRSRNRGLHPDEVKNGSITLTNFGMSGALIGLPIIRYPESAIIGMGAIQKRPIVSKDNEIVIREIVHATVSIDHRVVDGMYAGNFIKELQEVLESDQFTKLV